MTTAIYLVRHCSYQNPQKIDPSRLPGFPLDVAGKKKAKEIASFFKKDKKIEAIYSSPLLRTKQTAQIIAESLNLKILMSSSLIETRNPLCGMTLKEFFKIEDIYRDKKYIDKGGESIRQISERMGRFIQKALRRYPNRKIIAVSHGDPIMICVDMLTKGKVKEPLSKRKDYFPKGGIVKLVFNRNKELESLKRIDLF